MPPGKTIGRFHFFVQRLLWLISSFSLRTLPLRNKGGPPHRRASFAVPGTSPLSTPGKSSPVAPQRPGMPSAPMGGRPPRRQSFAGAPEPPRGPPPSRGRLGMAPPGIGPNSPKLTTMAPRGPAPTPPKGPPPRGPPPRGPPGHYLGRPSVVQGKKLVKIFSRKSSKSISHLYFQPHCCVGVGGKMSPDPPSSKHPLPSAPPQPTQMSPIRNSHREQVQPSAPPHPDQPMMMPRMTPIRNPMMEHSSVDSPKRPLMSNNDRPLHPSPLGKPPPHIPSQAPPITPQPQRAFGKLVVTIIKGLNLKAGQGVFGRADPYVKIKLGDSEFTSNTHKNGGKNPVSSCLCIAF